MRRFVEEADRGQWTSLPECLDDFIDESNPARVIDVLSMRSIWLRCALKGLSRRRLVSPRTTPPLSLLTVFDDGLAARTVLVFFLDHRRTLALLDDSGTVPIPLAVVIAVALPTVTPAPTGPTPMPTPTSSAHAGVASAATAVKTNAYFMAISSAY
jgi:hypothetical protein